MLLYGRFLVTKLRTSINSLFDCYKYLFIFTIVVIINNNISEEKIYIGRTALRIILFNLISNAVKYSDEYGSINIGSEKGYIYIENTYENKSSIDIDKIFDVNFDLSKKNSNGLGLYIVSSLLKNYKIKYRATQGDSSFKFEIELNR